MAKNFGAITTGDQTVTATGAVTPTAGLDISSTAILDYTLWIHVKSLTAAKKAVICLEDSVNGFTASVPRVVINPVGAVGTAYDQKYSFRKYQVPSTRVGTTSAVLRANIVAIDSATTLVLNSWIEYDS